MKKVTTSFFITFSLAQVWDFTQSIKIVEKLILPYLVLDFPLCPGSMSSWQ